MRISWLRKAVCRKGTQKDICILELCTCYLTAKGILKQTLTEVKGGDYSTSSEGHTVFELEPFSIPVCFCFSCAILCDIFFSISVLCSSKSGSTNRIGSRSKTDNFCVQTTWNKCERLGVSMALASKEY